MLYAVIRVKIIFLFVFATLLFESEKKITIYYM